MNGFTNSNTATLNVSSTGAKPMNDLEIVYQPGEPIIYNGHGISWSSLTNDASKFYIEQVIQNGPATVIIWKDGHKTVVKKTDSDEYDAEKGFLYAVIKGLTTKEQYQQIRKHLPYNLKEVLNHRKFSKYSKKQLKELDTQWSKTCENAVSCRKCPIFDSMEKCSQVTLDFEVVRKLKTDSSQ